MLLTKNYLKKKEFTINRDYNTKDKVNLVTNIKKLEKINGFFRKVYPSLLYAF